MILQPKRWQSADDPKYDPIRHRPWFSRLLKRKHIIPLMESCYNEWIKCDVLTQEELCDLWNVSPREFRDYAPFRMGQSKGISPTFLSVLTSAYNAYREHSAIRPIQRFIADVAPLYGINYRHVWEQWEVDPLFYPSDYAYPRN